MVQPVPALRRPSAPLARGRRERLGKRLRIDRPCAVSSAIQTLLGGRSVHRAFATTRCHAAFLPGLPNRRMETGTRTALSIAAIGARRPFLEPLSRRRTAWGSPQFAASHYGQHSKRREDRQKGSDPRSSICHVHSSAWRQRMPRNSHSDFRHLPLHGPRSAWRCQLPISRSPSDAPGGR